MDPRTTARLREEQIKAIQETEEKIDKLNQYVSDYVALRKRLNSLPDKTTHDIMVPFGKAAFMPGQLVHTNEIMVLLGDNWFCERSAKQAADITSRRIESLKKQVQDLEKQKGLLEPRLNFTTELQDIIEEKSDVIEIKEEYDAEAEKAWREKHRERVRSYRNKMRALREKAKSKQDTTQHASSESNGNNADAALWQRLEELEIQEQKNREMLLLDQVDEATEANSSIPSQIGEETKKRVKWKDLNDVTVVSDQEISGTESELTESGTDDSDDGSEDDVVEPQKIITFTHTPTPDDTKKTEVHTQSEQETPKLNSPADIYNCFVKTPKSILKEPSERFPVQDEERHIKKNVHHVIEMKSLPGEPEPFTGTVLEKEPCLPCDATKVPHTAAEGESSTGAVSDKAKPVDEISRSHDKSDDPKPAKKVSRFKARQMKKAL